MPYYKKLATATKPLIYPTTWDSNLQTWLNAHNAPLLDNQKEAINNFIIGLKADGLWNKIGAFYILKNVLPNDITNYWKYNLKNPSANTLTFHNTNVTVDRIRKPVYYTNGYESHAKTGYVFSAAQRFNKHLMVFINATLYTTTVNDFYGYEIGQASVANGVLDAIAIRDRIDAVDLNKFRLFLSDNNNTNVTYTATGFHCGSRLGSSAVSAVRNNVVVMDNVASAAVDADNGQEILIGYANGKIGYHTSDYASMGDGLTQAEMLLYNARINTLDAAFYNMELQGDYYGNDPTFGLPKMKTYTTANIDIKRLEINGVPMHLLAQRDSIKIAFPALTPTITGLGDDFYVSSDCGLTWSRKRWIFDNLHYASNTRFMHIFGNGTIIFATRYNKLWRTTDYFDTVTEITLQNADGSPYVYHTPVNPLYPGSYFKRWNMAPPMAINGSEVIAWGNWGNDTFESQGANPINVYYSDGTTVKVVYTFGQYWRDNGTAQGSGTTGTLLGDPTNPIAVYHIHCVTQNPNDGSFWVATGEENANARWMRGVYDHVLDTWSWTSMAQGDIAGPSVRAGVFWWKNSHICWVSDAYQPGSTGIFRLPEANIGLDVRDYGDMLHPILADAGAAMVWGDEIVSGRASVGADRTIYYSKDGGETWYEFNPYLQDIGYKSSGWLYKDTNGYFAYQKYYMPLVGSYFQSESYLIKFNV